MRRQGGSSASRIRLLSGAVAVLAAGFGLTAAPAPALAAGWAPSFVVSPASVDGKEPQAALTSDGTAIALWVDDADDALYASIRPPAGAFGPAAKLSANGNVTGPRIVVDGAGNALAVWRRAASTGVISIEAAVRPTGGVFGSALSVTSVLDSPSDIENQDLTGADAALSPDGTAAVIWHRTYFKEAVGGAQQSRDEAFIELSMRPPGGQFQAPEEVEHQLGSEEDEVLDLNEPRVAFTSDGHLGAVWMRHFEQTAPPFGQHNIESAFRSPEGFYTKTPVVTDLTPNGPRQDRPQLSIAPADGNRVFWRAGGNAVKAARSVNGAYTTPATIDSGASMSDPRLAAGSGGVTAAWIKSGVGVRAATTSAGGDFDAPGTIRAGDARNLDLAADPLGNTVAVWDHDTTGIEAAVRSAGASFGTVNALSVAAGLPGDPDVTTDAAGNALAVWRRSIGADERIEAAVYDRAPPTIVSLQVPAQGVQGSALAMSVSATDAWSPFTVSWNFGDGSGASGTSTSHSYAAAGDYDVTVTVTDAAGNPALASAHVTVGAGGGSAGGGGAAGGSVIFDRSAPDVSSFSLARKRFAVGTGPTALEAAPVRRGTTFRYSLSEAATVRILFERTLAGRRVGKSCRRPTRKLRRKRRCTRYVAVGTLTRRAKAGANATPFSGRLGRKALRPDGYRATLTATDAAGNRSAGRQARFTIVRFF